MDQIKKHLDKYKYVALSDADLANLMEGQARIVIYGDICKFKSIDEMLEPYGVCFVLYEWKPHFGHWCVLIKHDDLIEFFDPYGKYVDMYLKMIPEPFRSESNQFVPALSNLLLECDYDLSYNEYQFQKMDENVRDCGRWCCVRAMLKEMSLKEFKRMFLNKEGDDIVTILTT